MDFFTSAGALLKRGVSNVGGFFGGLFQRKPIASQSTITAPATTTRLSDQKKAQNISFADRVFFPFKPVFEKAKLGFDKAKVGFKNIFKPREIRTISNEIKQNATEVTRTGIRTLASFFTNKITGRTGDSGTPQDIRPLVKNKAPATTPDGERNFLGGFEFPFLASLLGQQTPIPTVPDSESNVSPASASIVTSAPQGSNLGILLILGVGAFLFFRGRK